MKDDYRNLEGKVQQCIRPTYLSGAGKPATVRKKIDATSSCKER